jgi:starch synthase
MKVLYVASEAYPFAKSGGLGDVAGSLPQALSSKGISVKVIIPLYGQIGDEWRSKMTFVRSYQVDLGWRTLYAGLFELKMGKVTYYFIDNEYYFKREGVYGYFDDGERFAYFSRAVVTALPMLEWKPDLVHVNDWQTGLVPVYLKDMSDRYEEFKEIKTLFTIHNIEYQGRFSPGMLEDVCGLSKKWFTDGTLEYMGDLSIMKGAILLSDYVNTVSPTYAEELKYPFYANGLDGVLSSVSDRFCGILNGIDTEKYDPAADDRLPVSYNHEDMTGKAKNKADFQRIFNLREEPETPMIVCIARLVAHKGMDLVLSKMDEIMGCGVQFAVLGTGDYKYEQFFRICENRYPERFSANITFSDDIARRLYAAGDIFLMPSQKEPCGLSQMISMRYGTLPLVRETGGLKDTVKPYPGEYSNGFAFYNYNAEDMLHVIREAVNTYHNQKEGWRAMMIRAMTEDFGWGKSALEYRRLYAKITGKR